MAERRELAAHGRIRSEARGRHWAAWVADTNGKPEDSVVFVSETQEEAEERAKAWEERRAKVK